MSTLEVRHDDPTLHCIANAVANDVGTSQRALHLRLLLHLPRIATHAGLVTGRDAHDEAVRLARGMPPADEWRLAEAPLLGDLRFVPIDDDRAREVCTRFHYLGSPRDRARSFGLLSPGGALVALAVTTACDVATLRRAALDTLADAEPRVLARVFAFEGAPKNCLTSLFKRVRGVERADGARSLVTYVNPNLGFTGASYKADNWQLLAPEAGTTYRYLGCDYITDRVLAGRLGAPRVNDEDAVRRFGSTFVRSRMRLAPLLVFGRRFVAPRSGGGAGDRGGVQLFR